MVTDSIIRIGSHIYHLECQSTKDETMVSRMFEYDISIALEHASFAEHAVWEIEFPQSCVLYIRNHRSLPDYHEAIEKIADYIIPEDNEIRKGLGEIMGGKILKLRSEELLEQGEAKGRIDAVQNMIKYNVPKEKILLDYTPDEYEEALNSMSEKV